MKAIAIVLAVIGLTAIQARADSLTESAQQVLKEQGFYYGDINGKKDPDTTAAIRRYQIRNGLKITGEINPETQKSLGIKGRANDPGPRHHRCRTSPPPSTRRPINPAMNRLTTTADAERRRRECAWLCARSAAIRP